MSAIVVFSEGEPWFTNSHTWSIILDCAMQGLDSIRRDEYEWYIDGVGLDFTSLSREKSVEVASWFIPIIDQFQGDLGVEHGWGNEPDRAHFRDLANRLLKEMQEESAEATE
jgi:hypothetical protein